MTTEATAEYIAFIDHLASSGAELTGDDVSKKERLYAEMKASATADRETSHTKLVEGRQSAVLDEIGEEQVVKQNHSVLTQWKQLIAKVADNEVSYIDLHPTEYAPTGQPGLRTTFEQKGQGVSIRSVANDPSGQIEQLMLSQGKRNISGADIIGLRQQYSTLTSTTDAPVPVSFIDMWSTEQANNGVMLDPRVVDVERVTSYEPRTYPRLASEPTITLTPEADSSDSVTGIKSITRSDPGYDEIEIKLKKFAALHAISDEMLHSSYIADFVGEIADVFAYTMASALNKALTTGAGGTDEILGLVTAAKLNTHNKREIPKTSAVGTRTHFTMDNALKLYGDLDIGYRENSPPCFMSKQSLGVEISLTDSTNRFVGAPNMNYGTLGMNPARRSVASWMGSHVLANPAMSDAPNTANNLVLMYGDFKAYKTLLSSIRLDFSTHSLFEKAALDFRILQYAGGALRQAETRGADGQKGRIVYLQTSA